MTSFDGPTKTPYLDSLLRDGYVVVRDLIPAEQLQELRAASEHIVRLARNNQWPYVRTVPKQYPPWTPNSSGTNIWGVQHLLHPAMPNRNIFASLYFGHEVLNIVRQLICPSTSTTVERNKEGDENETINIAHNDQTNNNNNINEENQDIDYNNDNDDDEDEDNNNLVMELFNLLISPGKNQAFSLKWHRDDIKAEVSTEQEQEELDQKSFPPPRGQQLHAQYNIALTDNDSSLMVIPGSHRRVRTQVEREVSSASFNSSYDAEESLPDQICVMLNAGDAVFYNSNILHRGVYEGVDETVDVGRLALHGCVGLAGHGSTRARQVLQHAVGDWVDQDPQYGFGLEGSIAAKAEAMRKRLIDMGKGVGLGYSLEG